MDDDFSITIDDISMNDTYFFNKLNFQLQNLAIQQKPVFSLYNTPLFISENNSDQEDEKRSPRSEYQIHNEIIDFEKNDYKQLTFQQVEKSIEKYYDCETKYYNEFDLLITYLNGQKHLYIQSQKITQTKLNLLIIPSLFMSATITLFLPLSSEMHYSWTIIFVSILNALITLLISLVNYYKLESTYERFGQLAYQYEKLQSNLEFKNNRLLFIQKKNQKTYILKEIKRLEKKMIDIKNSCSILVPEELNKLFPIIYHINIFSVIKKIENYRIDLIYKFRDVKNEIRFILFSKDSVERDNQKTRTAVAPHVSSLEKRLNILMETKEKIRKQIISYKNSYHDIDSLFNREIKFAESYRNLFLLSSCCITKKNNIVPDDSNEIYIDIINQF